MNEDENYYFTKEKHKELVEELEFLRGTKRKEIAQNLEHAKSLGDLSENAEYHEARAQQVNIEERIQKLEEMLKSAVVVSHKKTSTVEIGSTVTVKKKGAKKTQEFLIAGSEDSDLSVGKISYSSPLGSVLMGKKKGDEASFDAPNGETMAYKIEGVK